jgi:hypothetical protein
VLIVPQGGAGRRGCKRVRAEFVIYILCLFDI